MSHNSRLLEATSGQGAVLEVEGEGNKLFSTAFGLQACTLPNLVLAKSGSREEEQGQGRVW